MFPNRESQPLPSGELDGGEKDKDASNQSIPLAPLTGDDTEATNPSTLGAEKLRLDVVLTFLVLVLAGLLSAFPVRNSDFWMHLATGRRILAGEANFGVDPFSYTTAGVYWANTSWAYDVALYTLTRLGGGPDEALAGYVVVGTKTLLMVLLAFLMIMTRRPRESLWAPATLTMLALLAINWRLNLQPMLCSAFFVGLTIFILQRPRHEDRSSGPGIKSGIHWLLPVIFMIWANVDEWFILGPAILALFLVGQFLQPIFAPTRTGLDAPEPGHLRRLGLVLLVGLAACLVNPFHIHAFAIPAQISPNLPSDLLSADRYLRSFAISIFDLNAFPKIAGLAGAIATYLLIVFGILSFILTFKDGWRWWRLMVWGALFFLAAYQARLLVFFAVAAGPITALNFQDFARSRLGTVRGPGRLWNAWSIGGRLASGLTCLVVLLLAWPGWLLGVTADGRYPHRVGLKLEPEASVAAPARLLADWQNSGKIPADAHMFNAIPDLPAYFAWYQPGSEIGKGFLDYRFSLFPKNIFKDYLEIRQALREGSERLATTSDLTDQFRRHKIQYLALDWADLPGLELVTAIREWGQWKVLYMEGSIIILQRPDSTNDNSPASPPRLDPNLLAFGSPDLMAPNVGPGRGPRALEPWQLYADGPAPRPLQALSAQDYLVYYEAVRRYWPWPYVVANETSTWSTLAASSFSTPFLATGVAPLNLVLSSFRTIAAFAGMAPVEMVAQSVDAGPPGALLLSVRYARQALAAEPDNLEAYSRMASAYNYISRVQEDHWAATPPNQPSSSRQMLRRIQLTTILEQILKARPEDAEAHRILAEIYGPRGPVKCLDLALEHQRFTTERAGLMGPENGEPVDAFRNRMESLKKDLDQSEANLTKLRNAFELAAQNRSVFEKANLAVRHGLGGRALELMMESDLSKLTEPEIKFVLDLLITQGRAEELEQVLREEFRRYLGVGYDWYKAQAGAALGNYEEAYKALENAAEQLEGAAVGMVLQITVNQTLHGATPNNIEGQFSVVKLRQQQAEFLALAGIIALEQGSTNLARASFEKALATGDATGFLFESKPVAKRYLEFLNAAAKAK
jgi:tetratricopeptide (TPR) repeat protein